MQQTPNATRSKRKAGELDALLVDLLARANGARSVHQLVAQATAAQVALSPVQAYRIIDRLMARGWVRRVETGQSYLLSDQPDTIALNCSICGAITLVTAPEPIAGLQRIADNLGFAADRLIVEVIGRCHLCDQTAPTTDPLPQAAAMP